VICIYLFILLWAGGKKLSRKAALDYSTELTHFYVFITERTSGASTAFAPGAPNLNNVFTTHLGLTSPLQISLNRYYNTILHIGALYLCVIYLCVVTLKHSTKKANVLRWTLALSNSSRTHITSSLHPHTYMYRPTRVRFTLSLSACDDSYSSARARPTCGTINGRITQYIPPHVK